MSNAFHDQLVATRDKKHSKNHPFFELWAQGKLTKEQTAFYCTQHYHFVGEFLNWLAYLASQIPERDVKNYLYENLGDEENPDDRHLDMLKDYVAASGVDRNSVEGSIVLGGTEQLQNWGWMMVYRKPWPVAAAGLFIGLESQFLDICKKIVPALHQHYGYQGSRPGHPLFRRAYLRRRDPWFERLRHRRKVLRHAGAASRGDQAGRGRHHPALALYE